MIGLCGVNEGFSAQAQAIESPVRSSDMSHRRKLFAGMAITALTLGVAVLLYHGPGRSITRGNVGDGAATLGVYAVLGFVLPRARIRVRALAVFAFACAIELGQSLWQQTSSLAGELVLGSTCDPWDILAYAIGVAVAVTWERGHERRYAL
jgi:hypothetical protein